MTIYFFSGLGADSRAFKNLVFEPGIKTVFVDWIEPYKNEPMAAYAKRLTAVIDQSAPFILIGLSFGGMLATEALQFISPQKTILISSAARRQELPFYYKMAGALKLNKLLPKKNIHKSNMFTNWVFSISSRSDRFLLEDILTSSNPSFSQWAINEIVNWKRTTTPENIIRIHGNKDRVLPIINFKPHYLLDAGGHFMIVNRAAEISGILRSIIAE
ncbi:alpha/beta fold hydrolase [Ferruginibacter sp.]